MAEDTGSWYQDYSPSGDTIGNIIGQAMTGFVEVEKAKVDQRLNATRPLQSESMGVAPKDDQADRAQDIPGNSRMIWIAGGIAAVVVLGLAFAVARK